MNKLLSFNYSLENEEVLYTRESITKISAADIDQLVIMAKKTKRKRIRICAHPSKNSPVHDMLIVHFKDTYVRPHRHINKDETFHIIQGELKVVIFNDDGSSKDTINMGEFDSGKTFFYRMAESYYHTVIPKTDVVVFHETTKGPFSTADIKYPSWAPDGSSCYETQLFMNSMKKL